MNLFSQELLDHMKEKFPALEIGEINKPPYPKTLVVPYNIYKAVEQELLVLNAKYVKFHKRGFTIFRPDIKFMPKKQYLKLLEK